MSTVAVTRADRKVELSRFTNLVAFHKTLGDRLGREQGDAGGHGVDRHEAPNAALPRLRHGGGTHPG